jgi:dihydroorotate dehydrogenase (NAD+) catalytic subunit
MTSAGSTGIELAPQHKQGLALTNPILLACGVIGYGDAQPPGLDVSRLGGFVTAPVTRRPVHGQPPQVVEGPGGLLWQRGRWNPGIRNVLRDHAALWRRSPSPVIVHIAGDEPDELAAIAEALEQTPGVAGLEIDLFTVQLDSIFAMADTAAELVKAVRRAADLPLLARLPLGLIDEAIEPVLDAGVDALVLAQPPAGLSLDPGTSVTIRGGMHGPALTPQIAARLTELAGWVGVPLVACGGVHSVQDALTYLAIGAKAVQIDTAVWVDPGLPGRIAAALAGS